MGAGRCRGRGPSRSDPHPLIRARVVAWADFFEPWLLLPQMAAASGPRPLDLPLQRRAFASEGYFYAIMAPDPRLACVAADCDDRGSLAAVVCVSMASDGIRVLPEVETSPQDERSYRMIELQGNKLQVSDIHHHYTCRFTESSNDLMP
jgi:hypothetical protein